jgi:TPR repeat protein
VEPSDERALDWLRRSARNGFAKAQAYLGLLYAEGNGVSKDMTKAREWSERAANQGHKEAQSMLAAYYAERAFTPDQLILAYKWARIAANSGDEQCRKMADELGRQMSPKQIVEADLDVARFTPKEEKPR